MSTAPILLRPSADLAAAMAAAADESGCSRQTWMLAVLTDAVTELGHWPLCSDEETAPLFDLEGNAL